jgi:pyruvate,water dikinase
VEERRREYEQSRYLRTPEVIRDGEDFQVSLHYTDEERFVMNGETASPGRVTGPARIVRQPEDLFAFQEGDILVAQYTEPSWAPVLSLVSGLVLEVGGLLSHGAIVAREYGIPALIQVDRAVERIRTGDRLELDTERGCVRVLRKGLSA